MHLIKKNRQQLTHPRLMIHRTRIEWELIIIIIQILSRKASMPWSSMYQLKWAVLHREKDKVLEATRTRTEWSRARVQGTFLPIATLYPEEIIMMAAYLRRRNRGEEAHRYHQERSRRSSKWTSFFRIDINQQLTRSVGECHLPDFSRKKVQAHLWTE